MLFEDRLTELLKCEQLKLAHETLKSPPGDYPAFMKRVGQYKGLEQALQLISKTREDIEKELDRA